MAGVRTMTRAGLPRQRLFTIDEYDQMLVAGILTDEDRVELIEGVITHVPAKYSPHAACVSRGAAWFVQRQGERYLVRAQDPIRLPPMSEPEPDIILARWRDDYYEHRHPEVQDILLVIEVSDSTEAHDRRRKLPMYARAGIAESWLFLIASRTIEAHRTPINGRYTDVTTYQRGESLSPLLFFDLMVPVTAMLGT